MGIVGKDHIRVKALSEVKLNARKTEIALAVDQTGSMWQFGDNRLARLQAAADRFVDQLKQMNKNSPGLIKASLVPWASAVKIKQSWENEWWVDKSRLDVGDRFKGCIWNRLDRYQPTTDRPRLATQESLYQAPSSSNYMQSVCDAWFHEIMPLTSDLDSLMNEINSWNDSNITDQTNIPLGIVWAKNTLDKELPYTESD